MKLTTRKRKKNIPMYPIQVVAIFCSNLLQVTDVETSHTADGKITHLIFVGQNVFPFYLQLSLKVCLDSKKWRKLSTVQVCVVEISRHLFSPYPNDTNGTFGKHVFHRKPGKLFHFPSIDGKTMFGNYSFSMKRFCLCFIFIIFSIT